jgi:hypothetical protein
VEASLPFQRPSIQPQEPPPLPQITGASETKRKITRRPAPTANRETNTADVSGGERLHCTHRPPLRHRQDQKVPNRHGFRPLRVSPQTGPTAQGAGQLRPLRGQRRHHLYLLMAAPQPQLGITPGFHVTFRVGRCHTYTHRGRFPLTSASWWTAGTTAYWMESRRCQLQEPTRQLGDPECESHQWRYSSRHHLLRVPRPHSSHRSAASGAPQHSPPHPDYTRPTCLLPTTTTGTRPARYSQSRVRRNVEGRHSSPLRVPGPRRYTSCLRRTTVGVPAATIER